MSKQMDAAVRGALAGIAGTAMMTLMMRKVAPKVIPEEMRPDEFIPKKSVEWAEEQLGHPDALTESQEMKAAMAAHFTYGSGNGALYGLLRSGAADVPAPLLGALFGVGLWAVGFGGWMPALGIMEPPSEKPLKKLPMPIMAHVVYGATTALAYDALDEVLG